MKKLLLITHSKLKIPSKGGNLNKFDISSFNKSPRKENFPLDLTGNTIYVIDIYFTFQRSKDAQDQNGLDFYRYLLGFFHECQNRLKVVFYSPLSIEFLLRQKPENLILERSVFLQTSQHGNFARRLSGTIEQLNKNNSWPIFNSASENLLSGYSIYKTPDKINNKIITDVNILIVDDQIEEWVETYKVVFSSFENVKFIKYDRSIGELNKFSLDKCGQNFLREVRKANLVIADFYLEERHQPFNWMSREELQDKSGFKLFQEIRKINPAVPYIVHSSSNKIAYFKILREFGIDDWLIKDTRGGVTTEYKKFNYEVLKKVVETYSNNKNAETFKRLASIKKVIDSLKLRSENSFWWDSKSHKSVVVDILDYSWYNLRFGLSEFSLTATEFGRSDNFIFNSIISELGKILELKDVEQRVSIKNMLYYFLKQFRNHISHYDINQIRLQDCLIYFEIWIKVLTLSRDSINNKKAFRDTKSVFAGNLNLSGQHSNQMFQSLIFGNHKTSFSNRILFCYLQFINDKSFTKISDNALKSRINETCQFYLTKANSSIEDFKNELFNHNCESTYKGKMLYEQLYLNKLDMDAATFSLIEDDIDGYFKLIVGNESL